MIIVKVTFQIPKDLDLAALKGKFEETAPMYRDTKGLIRKNYICDLDKSIGGGIYCFESRNDADNWFDDARIEWLTNRYSKPDIEYFENPVIVDNIVGEILA